MTLLALARELGISPEELFRELTSRGLKLRGVRDSLDRLNTEALLDTFKAQGRSAFDLLFGKPRFALADGPPSTSATVSRSQRERGPSPAEQFERGVGQYIKERHPNSHLSGVFLFHADQLAGDDPYGRELDHLLHVRQGDLHRLIIIECKSQAVTPDPSQSAKIPLQHKDWLVFYDGKPKHIKHQLWQQARAVLQMLKPVPELLLRVEAIVVSSDEATETLEDTRGLDDKRVIYRLMSFDQFKKLLADIGEQAVVLRVAQSELLRRLRQGIPCQQLGHPDIRDAIDYHRRLRLTLDFGLFDHFDPTDHKWAINGTAGMGKSVLLAYAACVFCTDHVIKVDRVGSVTLQPRKLQKKGIPPLEARRVVLLSLKEKQRRIVEYYWRILIDVFQEHDRQGTLRIQRPEIRLWSTEDEITGNVVLVDEAHDLSQSAQDKLAKWASQEPMQRYLVIACDRHQKLRLAEPGSTERMISGLDFRLCTKRLKRVYRNPFSVYAAGLSLMFRWFAPTGPKVIPNNAQLKEAFGFDVVRNDTRAGAGCHYKMVEDAHPGNKWHHCVSDFPDATTAFHWLNQYGLAWDDVLWVRFAKEDPSFDYEQLGRFQYHNLNSPECTSIIDKYIKGQEFPVVVIEGFGEAFDDVQNPAAMFSHRRELYLCASRATVFLFFVFRHEHGATAVSSQGRELSSLLAMLRRPEGVSSATQFWGIQFTVSGESIPLSQFEDLVEEPLVKPDPESDGPKSPSSENDKATNIGATLDTEVTIDTEHQGESPGHTANTTGIDTPYSDSVAGKDQRGQPDTQQARTEPTSKRIEVEQSGGAQPSSDDSDLRTGDAGQNKYSLFDTYTPRSLAEYLDVKPYRVLKALMELPKGYAGIYSFDDQLESRFAIAKVCNSLGCEPPWLHPKLGRDHATVAYHSIPLTSKNLRHTLSTGKGKPLNDANIRHRLKELEETDRTTEVPISANSIFWLLRDSPETLDSFLKELHPESIPRPDQTKSN